MKKKIIGLLGVLLIGLLCLTTTAIAKIMVDEVQSEHIAEADGTSGQDTNSGNGIKTDHIQDGAVTNAKINDVDMGKVTGLQGALDNKADQTSLDAVSATVATKADQASLDAVSATVATKADQTAVDAALATKADQSYVDLAVENPVLPTNSSEPYTCGPEDAGAIALTSRFTTCACNGYKWVLTADGTTDCRWNEHTVLSAGQIWMDRNLGASQVATSPTDSAAYGDLYQWGRGADGHQLRTSGTTLTLSSTDDPGHGDFIIYGTTTYYDWRSPQNHNLWQGIAGINNPCPAGFRLPTDTEFDTELLSWSSLDYIGAFDSPLKLTMAGLRMGGTGLVIGTETDGYYWTSTLYGGYARPNALKFTATQGFVYDGMVPRAYGSSVRCIQD